MLLAATVLVLAVSVPVLGGRLDALADVRLRWPMLLPLAVVMQLASFVLSSTPVAPSAKSARIATQSSTSDASP